MNSEITFQQLLHLTYYYIKILLYYLYVVRNFHLNSDEKNVEARTAHSENIGNFQTEDLVSEVFLITVLSKKNHIELQNTQSQD